MRHASTDKLTIGFRECALGVPSDPSTSPPDDVIARVGDRFVTFSQLSGQLDSESLVGLSLSIPGSHARNTLLLGRLQQAITFNLLYLDAVDQQKDQDPRYLRALRPFARARHRETPVRGPQDAVPSCRAASATRYGQDDPDSDGLADVRKTKLVNLHRADLVQTLRPSDDDVRSFHQENKNKLAFREKRRVQTIVLPTREQAFFVKSEIENDTASDPWATRPRSATERVDSALHDLGWVVRGSGYPPLDRVIFQLEPGVVGGPVASPAGWHLVRVTEVRDGIVGSIEEASSRETVRRLLTERRLHEYVLELRKRRFPVVVYEDQLCELFREETRWGVA